MKWSKDNSIQLSKVCVGVFAAAAVVFAVLFPYVAGDFAVRRGLDPVMGRLYMMFSFYSLLVPSFAAFWFLLRLLVNISRGQVFVEANVRCLRLLSWACFLAAGICVVSAFYYISYWFVAAMAGFMGLILRVVKNVFAEAVAIKQENDFTI